MDARHVHWYARASQLWSEGRGVRIPSKQAAATTEERSAVTRSAPA